MNSSFWRNRRVLITGHTGFKGSWLSLWLQRLGATVIGYALPTATKPNLFETAYVACDMTSRLGDIRNLGDLSTLISDAQPEIVFHMAAQSLVRRSYSEPTTTYATNVMGTVNVLEAVRQASTVKALLNVTSDKCYDNREWLWGYRENEAMGGHDPYSSSKACAEIITSAYRRSFFEAPNRSNQYVAIASARSGNVFGGGDWAEDRLIPDMIKAFSTGRPATIRNPSAVRPWQHVLEPLYGYLLVAQRLVEDGAPFAEPWNFGPRGNDAKPVSWIADHLAALWSEDATWEHDTKSQQPHEAHYLRLDCSKANNRLGWKPILTMKEALEWTVEWHQSFVEKKSMRELTESQITRFQQRLGHN